MPHDNKNKMNEVSDDMSFMKEFELSETEVPEIKNWITGEKYHLFVEVKQTNTSQPETEKKATFRIKKAMAVSPPQSKADEIEAINKRQMSQNNNG